MDDLPATWSSHRVCGASDPFPLQCKRHFRRHIKPTYFNGLRQLKVSKPELQSVRAIFARPLGRAENLERLIKLCVSRAIRDQLFQSSDVVSQDETVADEGTQAFRSYPTL